MTDLDRDRLQQALALAESVVGFTDPNPRVGCILGSASGHVLGSGATQPPGGAHAEVMALRAAQAAGHSTAGATAWVTLEPCAHHGRTPPCCDALIQAGIARAVVAVKDPFSAVAGKGLQRMREAGIQVDMADAALARAAIELNIGFFSRVLRNRPWVRAKVAASLDGRTALPNGVSQWITGAAARADGHVWRQRAGAVMTGIGTVLADDPRLDARVGTTVTQPLRVVVDSRGRTPALARVLQAPGRSLIVTAGDAGAAPLPARQGDHAGLVEVLPLPARKDPLDDPQVHQPVNLAALMTELARRDINELHVEAGPVLTGALAAAGLVDEWLVYLAPKFLGQGQGMLALPLLQSLEQAPRLQLLEHCSINGDLRLRLRATPVDDWA